MISLWLQTYSSFDGSFVTDRATSTWGFTTSPACISSFFSILRVRRFARTQPNSEGTKRTPSVIVSRQCHFVLYWLAPCACHSGYFPTLLSGSFEFGWLYTEFTLNVHDNKLASSPCQQDYSSCACWYRRCCFLVTRRLSTMNKGTNYSAWLSYVGGFQQSDHWRTLFVWYYLKNSQCWYLHSVLCSLDLHSWCYTMVGLPPFPFHFNWQRESVCQNLHILLLRAFSTDRLTNVRCGH